MRRPAGLGQGLIIVLDMNFEGKRRYFVAYYRAACLNETNIKRIENSERK